MNTNYGDYRAKKVGDGEIYLPKNVMQSNVAKNKKRRKLYSLPPEVDDEKIAFPELYPHYLLKGFTMPVFEKEIGLYTAKGDGEREGQKVVYIPFRQISSEYVSTSGLSIRNMWYDKILVKKIIEFLDEKNLEKGFWLNLSYPIINKNFRKLVFLDPDKIDEEKEDKLFFSMNDIEIDLKAQEFDEENNSCLLNEKQYVYTMIYGLKSLEKALLEYWQGENKEVHLDYNLSSVLECILGDRYGMIHCYDIDKETKKKKYWSFPLGQMPDDLKNMSITDRDAHHTINSIGLYPTGMPIRGRIPILVKDSEGIYKTMRPLDTTPMGNPGYTFIGCYNSRYPKSFLLGYEKI